LHAGRTRFKRKACARERWEGGRAAEGVSASVPVPLSCGGRACTILLQEGGGAQSCSQRRHVNEYGPIAAHTGCTIAGLPRFLTVSRRTSVRKAHGGRSFPGPSAYCVVHCWLVLQSELGVANFQLPRQLLSVCRRLRCDLGPETSTNFGRYRYSELRMKVDGWAGQGRNCVEGQGRGAWYNGYGQGCRVQGQGRGSGCLSQWCCGLGKRQGCPRAWCGGDRQ
jgi:hypothetical protein